MTDTNRSDVQLMKVDTRGRVRTTAKRRASVLEEFDRSGVSATKFAELAGIKYQTFVSGWGTTRRHGTEVENGELVSTGERFTQAA